MFMNEPQLTDSQVARTELKYRHALDLLNDLDVMISAWNSLGQITMQPVQAGPRRIEYRMDILSKPPIDQWSLTFADAIHNLRSALDTLAWETANLDPHTPPLHPKNIYFPTAKNATDWAQWEKRLTDIPNVYLERMALARSILTPSGVPFAVVLNQLDIEDKHRGLLQPTAGLDIAAYNLQVGPPPGVPTITGTLTPISTPKVIAIEQDGLVGGYTSDVDVCLMKNTSSRVQITASLELGESYVRVSQFSATIAAAVRICIDLVRYGQTEAVVMTINAGSAEIIPGA